MHIFIDESGNFVTPNVPSSKVSSVASLIIPDEDLDIIIEKYINLRSSWGFNHEVKGSKLTEKQISDVIILLRSHNVLVEIVCIDIATHKEENVERYKDIQAYKLVENLTEAHHKNIVKQLHEYKDRLANLPNQLFLQAMLSIQLMKRILTNATLYYSQCMPKELGSFNWFVDAKNANVEKTNYEELWSTLLMPIMQSNFKLGQFDEGDYSYFSRYDVAFEDMTEHQKCLRSKDSIGATDIKKLISENLSFSDSESVIGLQLVDIIASAFNRAMNGNLGIKGWRHLGALMAQEPAMLLFDADNAERPDMSERHMPVILQIRSSMKSILIT